MSVGANPTGITPRVAQQITQVQANRAREQATTVNTSPRTAALSTRANALTNTPAPAMASPLAAAPLAAGPTAPGGTTAPAPRVAAPAVAPAQAGPIATSVSMVTSAPFLAVATLAKGAQTKSTRGVGNASDDTGDVGRTDNEQSVDQPDALQEADQEQGAGEITEAGSTNGPST